MQSIDICIATFKRPRLLGKALMSIGVQTIQDVKLRVIVIDNDVERSATQVVQEFRQSVSFPVLYEVEPARGISSARNRALAFVRADYFAFIDDDETVCPDWLAQLVLTLQRYNADAVFGPVERILPPNAPGWAKNLDTFRCPHHATGTPVQHGGTGNVLVRTQALGHPPQQFHLGFGLSGGEDSEFFHRLHKRGKTIIWCDEAVAREDVPEGRLSVRWIRDRGYRGGQTFVRIFVRDYSRRRKIAWFLLKLMQLSVALASLPIARLVSYPLYVHLTVKIMSCLGQLSIVFGASPFEEYAGKIN